MRRLHMMLLRNGSMRILLCASVLGLVTSHSPGLQIGGAGQTLPIDVNVQCSVSELDGSPGTGFFFLEVRQDGVGGQRGFHRHVEVEAGPNGALNGSFTLKDGVDLQRPVEVHVLPLPYQGYETNSARMYLSPSEGRRAVRSQPLVDNAATPQSGDYILDLGPTPLMAAPLVLTVTCAGIDSAPCEIYPIDGADGQGLESGNYAQGGLIVNDGQPTQVYGWSVTRQVGFSGRCGSNGVIPFLSVARQGTATATALETHELSVSLAPANQLQLGYLVLIPLSEYVPVSGPSDPQYNRHKVVRRLKGRRFCALAPGENSFTLPGVLEGGYYVELWTDSAIANYSPSAIAQIVLDGNKSLTL